jgi:hypothetical protein
MGGSLFDVAAKALEFLPGAIIELLLRDGNRRSLKFKGVNLRVEVLDAEMIGFHRH